MHPYNSQIKIRNTEFEVINFTPFVSLSFHVLICLLFPCLLTTKSIIGNARTVVPFSALALLELRQGNNGQCNIQQFKADLE